MGENKQVRKSARGSTIPAREGNATNDLWYTIPYQTTPGTYPWYSMYTRKEEKEKKHIQDGEQMSRTDSQ